MPLLFHPAGISGDAFVQSAAQRAGQSLAGEFFKNLLLLGAKAFPGCLDLPSTWEEAEGIRW